MLVIDYDRSEKGPQRRRSHGRPLHCCCICGTLGTWGAGWAAFYSYADIDDGRPIPKFCSSACKAKGGADAILVTTEMIRKARDAEYRDPETVYREATEAEKYAAAVGRQKDRTGV